MQEDIKMDGVLDLDKYDYPVEETEFDLNEILGISTPEIEPDVKPAARKAETQLPSFEFKEESLFLVDDKQIQEDRQPKLSSFETNSKSGVSFEPIIQKEDLEGEDDKIRFDAPKVFFESEIDEDVDETPIASSAPIFFETDGEDADEIIIQSHAPAAVTIEESIDPTVTAKADEFVMDVNKFDFVKAKSNAASEERVEKIEQTIEPSNESESISEEKSEGLKSKKPKVQVIEEYSSIDEREDLLEDLRSLYTKVAGKSVVMLILFVGALYLLLGRFDALSFILPSAIRPESAPQLFCSVSFCLSFLCFLINIVPLFDGFKKLFRAKLTADGMAFALGLVVLLYDTYFVLNPDNFLPNKLVFDLFFVMLVLMNLLGKKAMVKNIYHDFELISREDTKTVIGRPNSSAIDNDVMVETGCGGDVLYSVYKNTITDYMSKAFLIQNMGLKIASFYFVLVALLTVAVTGCWIFDAMELSKIVLLGTATMSILMPVFSVWSQSWYRYKLGNALRRQNTMISDREGAACLAEGEVLVVPDTELLSCADISLRDMRIRNGHDGQKLLKVLAALYRKVGGPLEGFFDNIVQNQEEEFELPVITDTYYHDQLGYTFCAEETRYAVGNCEFMRQMSIDLPKKTSDDNAIYIALNQNIVGVFSVVYNVSEKTKLALQKLEAEGVSVAIVSNDFLLSEDLFEGVLENAEMITLLTYETARNCKRRCSDENSAADIVTYNNISGMAVGMSACSDLLASDLKHSAYKISATLFGVILVPTVLLLLPNTVTWLPLQILIYHVLWNIPNVFRALRIKL